MDVKFVTTTRHLVDTVPITDGQIVSCKDHNDMFYDMNQTRYRVGKGMWNPIVDDMITPGFTMNDATVSVFQFVPNDGTDIILQADLPVNFAVGTVDDIVPYVTMPVTTRSGYEFLGWYQDQECRSQRVDTFPSRYPIGKTIYYASWRKL